MPNKTKQEELHQKLYDISVANVVDRETGVHHYAIPPDDIIRLINSQVLEAVEKIKNEQDTFWHRSETYEAEKAVPLSAIEAIEREYK